MTVTGIALFGMILGGAFGAFAGIVGPNVLRAVVWPLHDVEPVRTAIVLGAFGGVLCGGALGGLAVVAQIVSTIVQRPSVKEATLAQVASVTRSPGSEVR